MNSTDVRVVALGRISGRLVAVISGMVRLISGSRLMAVIGRMMRLISGGSRSRIGRRLVIVISGMVSIVLSSRGRISRWWMAIISRMMRIIGDWFLLISWLSGLDNFLTVTGFCSGNNGQSGKDDQKL